eukprot:SAG11_NODE_10214_length_846_cov_1.694779_1_plen_34_part_10
MLVNHKLVFILAIKYSPHQHTPIDSHAHYNEPIS